VRCHPEAAAVPSTWSGRLAPTMAAVTVLERSVQATANSARVLPSFLAIAAKSPAVSRLRVKAGSR